MENAAEFLKQVDGELKKLTPENLEQLQAISLEVDNFLKRNTSIENAYLAVLLAGLHHAN